MEKTLFELDAETDKDLINGFASFTDGTLFTVLKNTVNKINKEEQDSYDNGYSSFTGVTPEVVYAENLKVMSRRVARNSIIRLLEQFSGSYNSSVEV